MKKKIKVGILLNSYLVPFWSYKMIEEINNSSYAEINLIVKNDSKIIKNNFFKKIKYNFNSIFYVIYRKLDKKIFHNKIDAFNLIDVRNILKVDEIIVDPIKTKFRDKLKNDDINLIKKHQVDLFIRMGFRILSGDILKISNYGVWSYHHGDNEVNRGGPPGVWEVINGWGDTGVTLQILNENLDGGEVLHKSFSLTNYKSVNRNVNNYYLKAISFLPSKIKELHDKGENVFFEKVKKDNEFPDFYSNPLFVSPTNKEMSVFLFKMFFRSFKDMINKLFYINQWALQYKIDQHNTISRSFYKFKKILPPKDRFWADPHILKKDDKYYIFIEELIYKENKGFISVIEMNSKGEYTNPVKVLEKDYHLSYPFVFEEEGIYYMIPESKENKTIDLYYAKNFPYEWEFKKTLIEDIAAVDATILFHKEKYWIFANVVSNEGASSLDELFLYSSETLLSDKWVSHPNNPIISDVRKSRPAGKLFLYKNNLYRPSQNCSKNYGYGMRVNQVLKLSETDYEEKIVSSIYPNWDKKLFATHTLSSCENLTVIDGCFKRKRYF